MLCCEAALRYGLIMAAAKAAAALLQHSLSLASSVVVLPYTWHRVGACSRATMPSSMLAL
jgi:hypothetical protein